MTVHRDKVSSPARRRFLARTAALCAAAAAPGVPAREPIAIHQRAIPKSGEQLPVIGMGTWRSFDVDPASGDVNRLREVLKEFYQRGGRVIDSSPMYGYSEALTGTLARRLGITAKLFFATKVWTQGKLAGERQMDTSAKLFQRDKIDLMQVHNLVDLDTQLASIHLRREQGRIRYAGVTHYHSGAYAELERAMRDEDIDFVQLNYSIGAREAERRLLPLAQDKGIAVIVNQPFEGGSLFRALKGKAVPGWAADLECRSWAQLLLKFVISHPAVTVVIPATSNPEHMRDNMGAGIGYLPRAAERQEMVARLEAMI